MWYKYYFFIFFAFFACNKTKYDRFDFDIILLIGQSNTYSGIYENDYDKNALGYSFLHSKDNSIKQLGRFNNKHNKIINAKEPLNHHTEKQNAIGFGLTFASLYKEKYLQENRKILIIPGAKSASGFLDNEWNSGDYLYNDVVDKANLIINESTESKIVAVLWQQGEADVNNDFYEQNLDSFIYNLRSDLQIETIPFILGGMVPYVVNNSGSYSRIEDIIKDTPNRIENTSYANPSLPFVIDKPNNDFDVIHFNADGLIEMGKRYFKEYELLKD